MSALTVFAALWSVSINIRDRHWRYVAARLGVAVIVGLIAEAVYRTPFVASSWRAWVYLLGLAVTSGGYLSIVRRERTRPRVI